MRYDIILSLNQSHHFVIISGTDASIAFGHIPGLLNYQFLEHRIPLTLTTGSRSQPSLMTLSPLETEKSSLSASQSSPLHSIRNRAQSLSEETSHVRQFMASDPTLDAGSRIKPSRSRRMWGVAKRLMLDQLVMSIAIINVVNLLPEYLLADLFNFVSNLSNFTGLLCLSLVS